MHFAIRSVRLAALLAVPALAVAAPPSAVAPEPGVEWENTVEMQMAGFSMPAQVSKSCVPKKGMTQPPGAGRDDCKVTRMENDGKTMSWSMVCEGKEKMSGDGVITQRPDGYDGKMTMRTADGEMLVKMSGKKLGTPCDAATVKRQIAAVQAETAASIAENCRSAAKDMTFALFVGPQALCKAPADRAVICERASSREGVRTMRRWPEAGRQDLVTVCGKDFATLRTQACAAAAKEEAATKGDEQASDVLSFIGSTCPPETRVLAQRECAGRYYTGGDTNLSPRYRSFCTSYAADMLDTEKKTEAKPKKAPEDPAQDAAKKAVKSLLPF